MNYYDEMKEKLLKNEIYGKAKDYSKERNKVLTYFEVGKLLSEAGKEYGKNIIGSYADKLVNDVGKKYNERYLRYMRQFYEMTLEIKWNPMGSILSQSHYKVLLPLKNVDEIKYYIDVCEKRNLTKRELESLIKSKEYERLSEETKNKLVTNEELSLPDLVPNPILIKSEFDKEKITEYALKEAILNNLDNFLKQLGNGFLYAGNEYKIKIGNNYNYIDLLLYNFKYKCFVVIELKVTELKKEHIGQIQVYMNYIDKNVKDISDDKTIGIIICSRNNQFIIEFCSDERIFAREFKITSQKGSVKMNYYGEIKEKLLKNEIYAKVKDYSKERNKVLTYFEVGKLLSEAGKKYGNDVIGSYAEKLAIEVGKKYNVRTLRRIRQFYNVFKDEKWSPSATVLTWSHYTELLALNDINKINYYIDICKKQSLI